jgi:integrating conjugative element membrane protein (TIGR03747 family)
MSNRPPVRQPHASARAPGPRGPLALIVVASFGLVGATLLSWMVGVLIELAGIYYFWPEQGIDHSRNLVVEDLSYVANAPRSVLVDDTVGFANAIVAAVERPYRRIGIVSFYERTHAVATAADAPTSMLLSHHAARVMLMTMYVAQDTLLRLAVAGFALPAFVLACLLGAVDGLVRRDLRRWGGGRESSFVYHHAKRYTKWALTGGFTLYLSWPFGGFNPALMVLAFSALVAITLSTTVASFKKYI